MVMTAINLLVFTWLAVGLHSKTKAIATAVLLGFVVVGTYRALVTAGRMRTGGGHPRA